MTLIPLPHQNKEAAFLGPKEFAGNFGGMGSGKTLTATEALKHAGWGPSDRVVIVVPPIAAPMWVEHCERELGVKAQWLKTGKTKIDPAARVFVVTYAIATKTVAALKELGPVVVICDEAHALFKIQLDWRNEVQVSQRTGALIGHCGLVSGVPHSWMLTGTPSTRWNDDFFPFLCRADLAGLKERCGGASFQKFLLRYCVTQRHQFHPQQKPKMGVVGNRNTDELNEWIIGEGLACRTELKEAWEAMPDFTSNTLHVPMKMDAALKQSLVADFEKLSQREQDAAVSRNDESVSKIRRMIGEAKIKGSAEAIIERVQSGVGSILVGAWHRGVIAGLMKELQAKKINVAEIHGSTSAKMKQLAVRRWNAGELQVVVGQIASMGVSLNMQDGGNHIVCVEQDWSPDIMDQFYARLLRMGQKRNVHADIFSGGTKLEEAVARIAGRKSREHKRVLS